MSTLTISGQVCYGTAPPAGYVGGGFCSANNNLLTPDTTTSHCDDYGCWYRYSDVHTEFVASGEYYWYEEPGEPPEIVGESFVHTVWVLSGTLESETETARSTSETSYIEWSGALFNGAHNVVGKELSSCGPEAGQEDVAANQEISSPSGICTLHDNANYDHNMVIQYSFQVPDYPGFWYIYDKSVVSHSATLPATQYDFDTVDTLPLDAYVAGTG